MNVKVECTNKDGCGGVPFDIWCIVDGKICPHLQVGLKSSVVKVV